MSIRHLPLLALLLAPPLRGEEFPLERHIPADYRSRYLSIAPNLNLSASGNEGGATADASEHDREDAGFGLALRHGGELSTRRLRLSIGNGLDIRSEGSHSDFRNRYVDYYGDLAESRSEREERAWGYDLHVHPSAQWFLPHGFFLSASAESRFHQAPERPASSTEWRLRRPPAGSADSALFRHSRSRGRSGSMSAGLQARAGAGIGRIEKVGAADRALHLFDRITEVTGRPVRISPEEMRALEARVEARRKRRDFLDARRASLYDLETVEMFLRERGAGTTGPVSTGVAGPLPPRALLAMAEEWFQSAPRRRESGFEARLQPFLSWTWNEHRSRETRDEFSLILPADSAPDPAALVLRGSDPALARISESRSSWFYGELVLGAGLEAAWRRPWRRRFQFDAGASARASVRSVETGESAYREEDGVPDPSGRGRYLAFEHPLVEGRWDLALSWYPDSRSRFTGGAGGTGSRSFDYTGSRESLTAWLGREPDLHAWSLHHRLFAEAEYLSGYRLSFTVGAAAEVDWSSSRDDHPDRYGRLPPAGGLARSGLDRSSRLWADLTYYLF